MQLRVRDTDRTKGELSLDKVSVDYIMIESFGQIVLTAPANLDGSAVSSSEIVLTWDDASGEAGYNVAYRESGMGPEAGWLEGVYNLAANSTSCKVEGLADNTAYDFQVCAFDDTSQSICTVTGSPITTLEDVGQLEVVIITLAEYKIKAKQLLVEATSSLQPQAFLTLVDFGAMAYSASDGKYIYQAKAGDPGNEVTVTSNLGGTATAVVTIK